MPLMLTITYGLLIGLTLVTLAKIASLAFDAGSVTIEILSAPVIIAPAIGLSSVLAGRSAVSDDFWPPGFASIGRSWPSC